MRIGSCRVARVVAWIFLAGCGVWACGQSSVDGAIGGRVVDRSGRPVPSVQVRVESAATHGLRVVSTGVDGSFLAAHVAPGVYRVTFAATGYQAVFEPVSVEVGAVAAADVRLELLPPVPLLSVEAAASIAGEAAPAPEQSNADPVVTQQRLEALPVDGQRWRNFALLLPETTGGSDSDGEAAISVRGLATTQNGSEIDGVSDEQSFGAVAQGTGGGAGRESEEEGDAGTATGAGGDGARAMYGRHAGAAYTFAQGAVQEFRVNSANGSALDGRAAGGVVTTVSKSGTSSVKGSLFYLARDSAWAAANPFSLVSRYVDGVVTNTLVKPRDLRQQFGGSVGGPVLWPGSHRRGGPLQRGSLFYFATLDSQRRGNPAISSPGYAGFFTLTATQQALLANRGVSRAATSAALNYLDSLTGTVARREDQDIAFGKLDWQISAKEHLSAQENRVRWSSPGGVRSEPVVDRGLASIGNAYGKIDGGVVRWVGLWSSHLSNEVRLAYSRDFEFETTQAPLPQEPAIGPGGLAPEVSIGPDGFAFGTPASLGRGLIPTNAGRRWPR